MELTLSVSLLSETTDQCSYVKIGVSVFVCLLFFSFFSSGRAAVATSYFGMARRGHS